MSLPSLTLSLQFGALDDAATTGNIILGNWIGAGANGSTQVANSPNGINVNGATGTVVGDGSAAGRARSSTVWPC